MQDQLDYEQHEQDVAQACAWGWVEPPKEIIALAGRARSAAVTPSGQLFVDLGVVSEETRDKWLAAKPEHVQTIAWFAQKDPALAPLVDQLLALKAGYPYYESLSLMSVHACMHEPDVVARADESDAAVMLIDGSVPLIAFSTFSALIKFRSMGRTQRQRDPIMRAVDGDNLQMAVGSRDEISAIIKSSRSMDEAYGSMESANVWIASSAENQTKPENREITRMIDHALHIDATDVALMPLRNGEMVVQMRKYGEMVSPKSVRDRLSPDMARQILSLLQSKSGANPTNTVQRVPTDGQISYRSSHGDAFLRLSFVPLNHLGEMRNLTSASIRILPRAESVISLGGLKLHPQVVEQMAYAMRISQGLVLIVGPTNSGKSTTVAGAIGEHVKLFGERRKRLSVEDPIERFLSGIQQYNAPMHIKDEAKRFEVILRAFKRHDPDMIWVGEVRDKVTADMCVSSASTGHIVLSTLHANDTVMAFDVLCKMVDDEKRFQLIESMALVISQRLVKEVCPHCSEVSEPTAEERDLFRHYTTMVGETAELPSEIAHANPTGCVHCHEGYVGLLPINEVLPFSRDAKDAAIAMLHGANRRDSLAKERSMTLLESAMQLLSQHKIDLEALLV